jgi:uncharacterized membrane protein YphA (DoxX/SURF4 family)
MKGPYLSMNVFVWILQIVLALAFVAAGLTKLTQSREKLRPRMGWVDDYSDQSVKLIGAAEVLGALGLVLPWWTGIAPILTPLAAVGLAVVMIGAIITHGKRRELPQVAFNVVLLVLAVIVAVVRF